ncbi:MAG: TolC family protein [Gemmatimonadota bacterium]|nr:TolC family protein [Gemmatimonadota bacterium]
MFRLSRLAASIGLVAAFVSRASAQRADTLALSLDDAVSIAFRTSDETRLAVALTQLAGAQLEVARASVMPSLRVNGTYSHVFESARAVAVGSVFNQPNTYVANTNLAQTLFQGGREIFGWRSARRLAAAAALTEGETKAQVALDVQRAYLLALYSDRALEIRGQSFQLASARVTQIEQFASAGRAARYDVLRARVDRSNQEPLLRQAEEDRQLALLDLKRILNVPAERPLKLTTVIDAQSVQMLLAANADTIVRVEDRPAVRAAELTARARHDAVTIAKADYLPTLTASITFGYQAFPFGNVLPALSGRRIAIDCVPPSTDPARVCTTQNGGFFPDRSLNLTMSWPIFDGFRTKGNVDLARAQAEVADVQLLQQREAVGIEIARANADLVRARSTFAARRENAVEANEAFQLANLRFTRGLSTQLDVSDAQLALLTAQTDEARSTYDLYLAWASLARALGKPIPIPAGFSSPARTSLKPDSGATRAQTNPR